MGLLQRASLAAAAGVGAAVLVGCGSSGTLLSRSESAQLSRQLDSVKLALTDHQCATARDALYTFENDLNQLGGVNSTLVSNLDQGASTIEDLTSTACSVPTQPAGTPTTRAATTTTTATVTTPTYSTPTYTQPPATTSTYPTQSATSTTGGTPVAPQQTATSTGPSNGGQGLPGAGTSSAGSAGSGANTATGTPSTTSGNGNSQGNAGSNGQGSAGF